MFRMLLIAVLPLLAFSACGQKADAPKMFETKGVVVGLESDGKSVRVKHEAIPDYMPAMTMSFEVKNTNEIIGLRTNDTISFRLVDAGTNGWIEQIRKVASASTNSPPREGPFRQVREVQPLSEGDPLPEYQFTNQFGKVFSTKQFKGQAVAITFIFTRCPFPTYCPALSSDFAETQKKLLSWTNAPPNWQLLTISFDPEFDTPEVLRSYGESRHYDPKHWSFATGALIDITALGEQLGLTFWRDETGSISHNMRTAVIDASGRVQRILIGSQWSPDELVAELVKAAAVK